MGVIPEPRSSGLSCRGHAVHYAPTIVSFHSSVSIVIKIIYIFQQWNRLLLCTIANKSQRPQSIFCALHPRPWPPLQSQRHRKFCTKWITTRIKNSSRKTRYVPGQGPKQSWSKIFTNFSLLGQKTKRSVKIYGWKPSLFLALTLMLRSSDIASNVVIFHVSSGYPQTKFYFEKPCVWTESYESDLLWCQEWRSAKGF